MPIANLMLFVAMVLGMSAYLGGQFMEVEEYSKAFAHYNIVFGLFILQTILLLIAMTN